MPAKRPKPSTIKHLFALSCNRCYYEGCDEQLSHESWQGVKADIAHIAGEKHGAARFDPGMDDEERRDASNLMLMCPNHHRVIDVLEPADHSVERLHEMRERHQSRCDESPEWNPSEPLQDDFVDMMLALLERSDLEDSESGDDRIASGSLALGPIVKSGSEWLVRLDARNTAKSPGLFAAQVLTTSNVVGPEPPWWIPWRHDRSRFTRLYHETGEMLKVAQLSGTESGDDRIRVNVQAYDGEADAPHVASIALPATIEVALYEQEGGEVDRGELVIRAQAAARDAAPQVDFRR